MKPSKRAVRRHHKHRMIQRAKKSRLVGWISENERLDVARKLANNLKQCSCEYSCGNPRHSGWSSGVARLTRQEIKSNVDFAEQVRDISQQYT